MPSRYPVINSALKAEEISGFYQNCRGLRTKLFNFNCNVACVNYVFIVLTETWLIDSISDSELGLPNYNIYRCDRNNITSNCSRGGGVLIAIRKDFSSKLISVPISNVEHVVVQATIGSINILIGGVYIRPNSTLLTYEQYMSTVENFILQFPNQTYIFLGDFNLPYINWANDAHGLNYSSHSPIQVLCVPEIFAYHGFYQKNFIYNKFNSLLDLVFSNTDKLIISCSPDPIVSPDPYHPPLHLSLGNTSCPNQFNSSHSYHNFHKANYLLISSFLASFDWQSTFNDRDVNSSVNLFMDALHTSILRFVPKVNYRKSNFPSWVSKELINLIRYKNKLHAIFKSSFDPLDYRAFSLIRAKCKYLSRQCHRDFVKRTENSLIKNPNKFWDFIRKNRSDYTVPKSLSLNGVLSSSEQESVNQFATHFSSVYTKSSINDDSCNLDIPCFDLPNNCSFTQRDVFHKLTCLRNVSSIGPDGISGDFLYNLRHVISFPLWVLFHLSLDQGIFPDIWKISSLTPIPKSNNSTEIENYRPIAILSHISKIFEALVLNDIQPSVNSSVLVDEQHGFRPGRSTVTCNLTLCNYIFSSFNDNAQVDVIYTDFSKAFDSVNHRFLLHILRSSGFGEPLLSWFESFLTNRTQWVKLFDVKSKLFIATSGVPQGGHLSPLLFSLYVNNAQSILRHSRLLCFADDMKLYKIIRTTEDCSLLQSDLDRFVSWSESLDLALNIDKCHSMSFTRTRSPIINTYFINEVGVSSVDSIRDLGFIFTPSLSPRSHINNITCKAYKLLGFIRRVSGEFKLTNSLKSLYCALVRPILEYGSVVWDPHCSDLCRQLEGVQRKFLNYASYSLEISCPPHDYSPVLYKLNLSTLADRRYSQNTSFLAKLISSDIDAPTLLSLVNFRVPSRFTRNSVPFHVPLCSTNYISNEPINRMMKIANEDPHFLSI